MADYQFPTDGLIDVTFDQNQQQRLAYSTRSSWPLPIDDAAAMVSQSHHQNARATATNTASTSPLQTSPQSFHAQSNSPTLLTDWPMQQQASQLSFSQEPSSIGPQINATFATSYQASPVDFMSSTQGALDPNMTSYVPLPGQTDALQWNWQDFQADLMNFPSSDRIAFSSALSQRSLADSSPTDTYLEVRSLTSSSSDNGWATVDYAPFDGFPDASNPNFINPNQTLHIRTSSDSSESHSDCTHHTRHSFGSFEEVPHALTSPESDIHFDLAQTQAFYHTSVSPTPITDAVSVQQSTSPTRSPTSTSAGSPPGRKQGRKSPIAKSTKPAIRRPAQPSGKTNEKRVGRRKGPLLPAQRKQAGEIRKLRACLRCKFLKKTCDKGEPCAGCQPSHARLWQVPCTRIDIKDIAYFMKDWKADFERHVSLGFSVANVKGYSHVEKSLYITHGYGYYFPVTVREVYVRDDRCFGLDWVESDHETPLEFEAVTSQLTSGMEGISAAKLSEYLDLHLDGNFEDFVDQYFEGTPFLTEMLKTSYHYYQRERLPVIRKALKLVLAYNLTMHVTLVEGIPDEVQMDGKISDSESKFNGKTLAPCMINFEVKCALAEMWRELQKDVLEELSGLYSSVYSGDKLKNWPTIFMLATILLAVWEEMQFDCHYRVPDRGAVDKFCNDMETTPVGVIVGLFSAISQKLPAFNEWDTQKHHHLLNSNAAVCDALSEVREHVTKYDNYLRSRSESKFDRKDFDSLSNKFLSKLVIRAN
ncbi:MAG: hypothetical protein M1814_004598 [Vezdaea aestivalis]|nr:MAG: hypothetical protein M1814_004598 [Vezdaea aestivalis]